MVLVQHETEGVLLHIQVLVTSVNKSICSTVRSYCSWKITSSLSFLLTEPSSVSCTDWLCVSWSNVWWIMCGELVTLLWRSIWNPQNLILFLLHDGDDLSANVGDAACLDDACNTLEEGLGLATRLFKSGLCFLCMWGNTSIRYFWLFM